MNSKKKQKKDMTDPIKKYHFTPDSTYIAMYTEYNSSPSLCPGPQRIGFGWSTRYVFSPQLIDWQHGQSDNDQF